MQEWLRECIRGFCTNPREGHDILTAKWIVNGDGWRRHGVLLPEAAADCREDARGQTAW
jgi:hypothetical protein